MCFPRAALSADEEHDPTERSSGFFFFFLSGPLATIHRDVTRNRVCIKTMKQRKEREREIFFLFLFFTLVLSLSSRVW